MTSFIIDSVKARRTPARWKPRPGSPTFCAFCQIIKENAPAYRVYDDEHVISILDILPIRRGHVLVIPKVHVERLSDLTPEYAGALGQAVSKVAKALTLALDNTALNVVCNQEYAQAVPHVHFHIVPAPTTSSTVQDLKTTLPPPDAQEMHRREFLAREELDEADAEVVMRMIRSKL